ncbi:flavoprotein, HI0933 family/uncharacterized flavoprotein, PP_4765 family [Actinobacteria bacterium IMCC26207]|nr:flavoprotein, HI0933 family/uncharacterized flavoprotein, PP_4765 family [Actinobacteria bacterium IMCC26207]
MVARVPRSRLRAVNSEFGAVATAASGAARPSAAVIGGGPGGLMAAEVLARAGASVTVYEHMPSMGRKFLIAGRGGLNITHSEPLEQFMTRYGDKQNALAQSVSAFPPESVQAWCESLSQKTFVGSSGRIFPLGFRATELLRSWLVDLETLGVSLQTSHRWLGWDQATGALLVAADEKNSDPIQPQQLFPDITIMSLGGGSWQRTGSDGRWVPKFEEMGINVHKLRPANSGFLVDWTAEFITKFEGMPVKNVSVQARGNPVRGEMMITADGIEGGCVYAVGRELRAACDAQGNTVMLIDLRPDLRVEQVEQRLSTAKPKESTSTLLRRTIGLPPVAIGLLREATKNVLPRQAFDMAVLIKSLPLQVVATEELDRAISTAGGVAFEELDDRFMLHRLPGVFVAGEMIDWEAPTGGYLLQATLSTAVAAANGALSWWEEEHPTEM